MEQAVSFQSQFLPGTKIQFAWDSTALGDLKKCPRYYQYVHIDGWSPKDENIHLRFGIEYHAALHDYELAKATGVDHDTALRTAVHKLLVRLQDYPDVDPDSKPSVKVKTKTNLVRSVVWYLDQFENDPAETVMLANGMPALEVSFKFPLDWGPERAYGTEYPHQPGSPSFEGGAVWEAATTLRQPYLLCGHLDRIVRYNDAIFVMDRKTATSTLTQSYFAQYEPNNQMTLYTLAGQIVLGTPIKGVIIDAITVQVGGSWSQRGFTFRTQEQLNEWMRDLKVTLAQAETFAVEGYWPMNDMSCSLYGGCRFRNVCSKDPRVRENYLRAQFVQLPEELRWNPLKSRG